MVGSPRFSLFSDYVLRDDDGLANGDTNPILLFLNTGDVGPGAGKLS